MGVERRRDGDDDPEYGDSTSSGDSTGRDGSTDGDGSSERDGSSDREEPASRVHVRRLDVVDTLRWSWEVLGERRELLGVALAVNLPSVVAALGITRPAPSAEPEFADWVPWLYLVQFLANLVVWGAVYLTAADAVANRSRPLGRHLVAATKRLPALVGAAIVMGVLVGLTQVPAVAAEELELVGVGMGSLLALLSIPVGIYVFFRLLLAYPACVIDRKGPVASSRASWRAATGIVRKVFAVGVVYVFVGVGLVNVLATVASNAAFSQFGGWYDVASTLVSAAFGAVLLPVFALALAHLYLEGSRNR